MRVLVTGGSGFLGRAIVQALSARDHEVVAPNRPAYDLTDRSSVERALREVAPDAVVHSAAYYGGLGICLAEPANLFWKNLTMSANVLDVAARNGVGRFVGIGSACAYPGGIAGDMAERDLWTGALHPSVEAYGFSKRVQDVGMRAYSREFPMTGCLPLLTNLYGEHDVFTEYRSHVVAALIKRFADAVQSGAGSVECWGTGTPVREFLYVADAAEAVARLLESDLEGAFNIGTGIGTPIKELAATIAQRTGFAGEIVWNTDKPDGAPRKVLDIDKTTTALGWRPPTSLDQGLQRTIDWYLANKQQADARV